ncbi:thiamine phosphate synthase [Bacillus massiliigorillae]|uniref:thiamine phosphate synthase n=1 Tax=Bacillus massiliigorillae TaxID=1243664 RepID=UPI00039D7C21|nr:thiamine phosphate synthase [Bacillus massiliigorillae]
MFQKNKELYLVTDSKILEGRIFLSCIEAALRGGVKIVQLREKHCSGREFLEKAIALRELTRKYDAHFIVNDRVDIAQLADADGVHIGQSDITVAGVHQLMGKDKIIGVSVNDVEKALQAQREGADYIGVGAMFPTTTKDNARTIDMQMLQSIKEAIDIPLVAIGGIKLHNIDQINLEHVNGIAVVSAILGVEDIYGETKKWIQRLG